LARDQYKMSE